MAIVTNHAVITILSCSHQSHLLVKMVNKCCKLYGYKTYFVCHKRFRYVRSISGSGCERNILAWLSSASFWESNSFNQTVFWEHWVIPVVKNRDFGVKLGENQHAFGVSSRPLAENESSRRDGGDFILWRISVWSANFQFRFAGSKLTRLN